MAISADLSGTRAFVTGASSAGLGAHFASTLARAGAEVVVAARRLPPLEDLVTRIAAAGGTARAVVVDVADAASVAAALDVAGPIDIVVNNAGIERSGPVLDITEADYDEVLDINLKGVWLVATEAARRMRAAGSGGSIINIASITGHRGMFGIAPYNISKAGVLHLTRQLAWSLARDGIRVNSISPGYFETDLNRAFLQSEQGEAMRKRIALRRFGNFSDLDGALLLLASSASAFMTGSDLVVDGGHLISPL
jgi:NAD(P)-dependent dehydrogenase (short-subunit alcohol dehydrogenase family)